MNLHIKLIIITGLCLLMLPSCVTVTEPVSMGEGRYMLSLNARGGFSNNGELLKSSIEHANAFCNQKGLHADILNTKVSGVQMWTPQDNEVVFKCVESE